MTPAFGAVLVLGVMGVLVGLAALDNLFRAARCVWAGHHFEIVYPSGTWGSRIAQCQRCDRRVVQL